METTTNTTNSSPTCCNWSGYKIAGVVALTVAAVALAILIAVAFFPNVAFIATAISLVGGISLPLFLSTLAFSIAIVVAPIFFIKDYLVSTDNQPLNLDAISLSSKESEKSDAYPEEEEEAADDSFIGAGVLPYHIAGDGEVYVLIGKEAKGEFKNQWSDFGGKRDKGETPLQTAAREAKEESKGLLGRAKVIRQTVENQPFSNHAQPQYLYYTFLLNVDNPTSINQKALTDKKVTAAEELEKSDIQWVKVNDLFHAVMNPVTVKGPAGKNKRVTKFTINGKEEIIRSSFARSLLAWLSHDTDRLGAIWGFQEEPATS